MDKLIEQAERSAESELSLYVKGQNLWVASPGKVTRYDWQSGKATQDLTVPEGYGGLISRSNELLVVDVRARRPIVTSIDLANGVCRTDDLSGSGSGLLAANQSNPPVAPSNRGATAGLPIGMPGKDMDKPMDPGRVAEEVSHLSTPARIALPAVIANSMSQERTLAALKDDGKSKQTPTTADWRTGSSSTLIPTKDGFVQFSVKLLESRMVERSAMKPASGKSALDGNVSAGRSLEVSQELLNEMQRDRGGDKVLDNESRYQVALRKPGSAESWTGEVVGPPQLFPLDTVNVLTANRMLMVFDKSNQKLWQSSLSHNVVRGLDALDEASATYGLGPCVQHKGTLYVFDEAVLTA
ncbi:MAG: hypothetical protein ACREIC_30195, partial [Limisphaerales bacterium]